MANGAKNSKGAHRPGRGPRKFAPAAQASRSGANRSRGDTLAQAKHNYERYTALARDAASAGDPIEAENFYQHAEHYLRTMRALAAGNEPRNEGSAPT